MPRRVPKNLPIEDYGVIGDMHTVALAGRNGSIDWFCYPDFDSPSVFGALLDPAKGGRFSLRPRGEFVSRQYYLPDTNILATRFMTESASAELIDFLPVREGRARNGGPTLVRLLRGQTGRMRFQMDCAPAFDYARRRAKARRTGRAVVFDGGDVRLVLQSGAPIDVTRSAARARFTVEADSQYAFVLGPTNGGRAATAPDVGRWTREQERTARFWRRWVDQCTYKGRWREAVRRSALVLKMLTFAPTGAMVAAPTTSLPESLGGPRNWDYRFTWYRDAAFVVYALLRIGFRDEAKAFIGWVQGCCEEAQDPKHMAPVYGIRGEHELPETELSHLSGYETSSPVRIGNAAYEQFQLDVFGGLVDAFYLYNKHGRPLNRRAWETIRPKLDWLAENWDQPDRGIWEIRTPDRNHTYSRAMCWVALDRGVRLAHQRGLPADHARWEAARDAIYEQVMEKGWDKRAQAFVSGYEKRFLDASLLMLPLTFFVAPDDGRMISTIRAIQRELASGPFVRRYDAKEAQDGLPGREGYMTFCSFWLVEALTRMGKVDEAHKRFEALLAHASPLGLFSEQVSETGRFLGNFPQALTHLALISAAFNLDRRLD